MTRTATQNAVIAITYALRQVGTPYRWGGTGAGGFDCSGLVMRAWAAAGVHLPRTSQAQAHAGTRITRNQLQPGDLVFTNHYGHVMLYTGAGHVVSAPHPGAVVHVTTLPAADTVDAYERVASAGRAPVTATTTTATTASPSATPAPPVTTVACCPAAPVAGTHRTGVICPLSAQVGCPPHLTPPTPITTPPANTHPRHPAHPHHRTHHRKEQRR